MKKLYSLFLLIAIPCCSQLQWKPLINAPSNPDAQRFDDVFFISETIGWAANGRHAAIYKTIDGGNT